MGMITLIVGDTHTEPEENLRRFKALSNFMTYHRPDNIVFIGDHLTLDSLSSYDRNKPGKVENKRLRKEIESGKNAITLFESSLQDLQAQQKIQKKRIYSPRKIYIKGNHEDRFEHYLDHHPELKGVLNLDEMIGLNKYKWEVVPYRGYAYVKDVSFTHVPMNGYNKPLNGERLHVNAAKDHTKHIVYGHTHTLVTTSIARHGERDEQVFALNCGCFFENIPEYAKGSKGSKNWWRGVILMDHEEGGGFNLSTHTLRKLLKEYL